MEVRGTQSFVHVLSACWRRPGVTALEVAWRWCFGIPALAMLWWFGSRALAGVSVAGLGLDRALLNDPVGALTADTVGASAKIAGAVGAVLPLLWQLGRWLGPVLIVGWIVISALGRTLVLRLVDGGLRARVGTLMGLQAVKVVSLGCVFWLWYLGAAAAVRTMVTGPLARQQEPNLVGVSAVVIVLSLGLFVAWQAVSWVVGIAPVLAMVRGTGVVASLRGALGLGALRAKLAEINLVLGIVKIALLVLAMVFSATPLPFESVTSVGFLQVWWSGVGLLYVLWSDFFHVARLVGYLKLYRAYAGE